MCGNARHSNSVPTFRHGGGPSLVTTPGGRTYLGLPATFNSPSLEHIAANLDCMTSSFYFFGPDSELLLTSRLCESLFGAHPELNNAGVLDSGS